MMQHTFALSGQPLDLKGIPAYVPVPLSNPTTQVTVVDGPLVIGCGHSTLQRIVGRAEMLFDEPLYGIVGGLHYPVTASREVKLGLPLQRIFGTGKFPWDPISQQDVEAAIAYLQRRHPRLVALSPHDSCDWSIEAFRSAFGAAYRDVQVGKEIVVG